MAIRRIRIDYTVYPPDFKPGKGPCWDFRTFTKAKRRARVLGIGGPIRASRWAAGGEIKTFGAGAGRGSKNGARQVSKWVQTDHKSCWEPRNSRGSQL
jgi:hypothetical protein